MKPSAYSRYALSSCVAAAMLAACGGSQPPIGAPGAMPQTFALAAHADRGTSWMLPDAKSFDLLYVSDDDELLVFSYPKGTLVGEISVPSGDFAGLCSDNTGDVFVTSVGSRSQSYILEYAHGGTEPIATLSDPGWPNGCAVDPTTGNVAVTNVSADDPPYYHGDVVVFPDGQGPPAEYSDSDVGYFDFCSYDATGDLFADGDGYLTELPVGRQSLSNITLDQSIGPSSIQWVSAYQAFVVADFSGGPRAPNYIYQVQISGSMGTVSSPTILKTKRDRSSRDVQFWTGDGRIIGPGVVRGNPALLDFWHYPKGGWPRKTIHRPDGAALDLYGVAVSRASARSHDQP
jgi:hypothetical protein